MLYAVTGSTRRSGFPGQCLTDSRIRSTKCIEKSDMRRNAQGYFLEHQSVNIVTDSWDTDHGRGMWVKDRKSRAPDFGLLKFDGEMRYGRGMKIDGDSLNNDDGRGITFKQGWHFPDFNIKNGKREYLASSS